MALRGVKRRHKRRQTRRDLRNDRKMSDLEAKADRKAFGDEHGIDASDKKPVGDFIQGLGGAVSGLFGGGGQQPAGGVGIDSKVLMIGGVVVVGIVIAVVLGAKM